MLTQYLDAAMRNARYEILEDRSEELGGITDRTHNDLLLHPISLQRAHINRSDAELELLRHGSTPQEATREDRGAGHSEFPRNIK